MQPNDGARIFPRVDMNKLGVIENLDSGGQEHVTLINFSGEGICIESDRPYAQATRVRLKMEFWSNEKGSKSYDGEVRWCNAVKRKESRRYLIGVKIQLSELPNGSEDKNRFI